MTPKDYRILAIVLGIMGAVWFGIVGYQRIAHPTTSISDDSLRTNTATPKNDLPSQLTYVKDHEQEWADANSGVRSKSLPAWEKILTRFRINVIGSGADAAKEGLEESKAWEGKITGDQVLDQRLIEAAVMSRMYREGAAWDALSKNLDEAASNDTINATLSKFKY